MTLPTNQIKTKFDTPTALAPTSSLISSPDKSTGLSTRLAARQIQHWQEELEYIQKENEQILLLYQLHLNLKCQSTKTTVKTLEDVLNNQLPPLLEQVNQIRTRLFEKGKQHANTDYKDHYVDLQQQLRKLKAKIRPLKGRILELMVDTLPVTFI